MPMPFKRLSAALAPLFILLLSFNGSSCASVIMHGVNIDNGFDDPKPFYMGVRADAAVAVYLSTETEEMTWGEGFWIGMAILDLPLSFAMDTVLLPVSLVSYLRSETESEEENEEPKPAHAGSSMQSQPSTTQSAQR